MRPNSKSRILEAAAKVFLQKGLESSTMADISKLANLTQPAMYVYFKNKMDLVNEVCLWSAQRARVYIDRQINESDPAIKRFESYIYGNLKFFKSEKMYAHSIMALYYFSLTHPNIQNAFSLTREVGLKRIGVLITSGNYEGAWKIKNVELVARMIQSLLIGECYRIIYASKNTDLSEFANATWNTTLGILQNSKV